MVPLILLKDRMDVIAEDALPGFQRRRKRSVGISGGMSADFGVKVLCTLDFECSLADYDAASR